MSTHRNRTSQNGVSSEHNNWDAESQINYLEANLLRASGILQTTTQLLEELTDRVASLEAKTREALGKDPEPEDFTAASPIVEQDEDEDYFEEADWERTQTNVETEPSADGETFQVTVQQTQLRDMLKSVTKVCPRSQGSDVLSMIKLDLKDGKLTGTCSDGDTLIRQSIEAPHVHPGSVLVPGKALCSMVCTLEAGEVRLALGDEGLEVSAPNFSMTFETQYVSELPEFPELCGRALELDASELRVALSLVEHLALPATPPTHYTNGILISHTDGQVNVSSTDGHQLGHYTFTGDARLPNQTFLVPVKAVKLIAPYLKGATVRVHEHDGWVYFELPEGVSGKRRVTLQRELLIGAKFIDQRYPEWERVFPRHRACLIEVDAKSLGMALRQAVATHKKGETAPVTLESRGSELCILTKRDEKVTSLLTVPCHVEGDDCEIALDGIYLSKMAAKLSGILQLSIASANEPMVVTDSEHPGYRFILMPIRK